MALESVGLCNYVDDNRSMLWQESFIIDLLPFVQLAHLSDSACCDLLRKRPCLR